MKILLPVILILVLCQGCSLGPEEGLRFNLQTGKVYEFNTRYVMRQEQGERIISDITNKYSIEVTEKSDNIVTVKVTYDDFMMSASEDSAKTYGDTLQTKSGEKFDPETILNSIYRSLKGKSFMMKLNGYGKVVEVIGLKELLTPIIDTIPVPEHLRAMGKQMFTSDFGTGLVAKTFSLGFDIFPNKPVKLGDSWEKEIQLNGLLPISTKTKYTVKAIEGNRITLDAKSLLNDNNRKGEVLSTYIVDAGTGLILDANMEIKFGIPVLISSSGTIQGRER